MRSRNVTILVMVMSIFLCVLPAFSWTQFNDGGTHNIDYAINDDVCVDWEVPGMQTIVNLLSGGKIYYMHGFNDCHINISGGLIDDYLCTYDRSKVTVSSGSIGGNFCAYDSSQVTISGGSIDGYLWALNSNQVEISGGLIDDYLWVYSSSQVTISGGSVGGELRASKNAILTIHGLDFVVDGQPFGYGELNSIFGAHYSNEPYRHLIGTLASGELIDNDFRIGHSAKIVLVPEPATLLLLGLGAVVLRRERRV